MGNNIAETVSQKIYGEFCQQLAANSTVPFLTPERLTEIANFAKIKNVSRDTRFQQILRHDLELPGGKFSSGQGGILEELSPEIVRENPWPVLADITQQAVMEAFDEFRQLKDAESPKLQFLSEPVLGVLALTGADLLQDQRFSEMIKHHLEAPENGVWDLIPPAR